MCVCVYVYTNPIHYQFAHNLSLAETLFACDLYTTNYYNYSIADEQGFSENTR